MTLPASTAAFAALAALSPYAFRRLGSVVTSVVARRESVWLHRQPAGRWATFAGVAACQYAAATVWALLCFALFDAASPCNAIRLLGLLAATAPAASWTEAGRFCAVFSYLGFWLWGAFGWSPAAAAAVMPAAFTAAACARRLMSRPSEIVDGSRLG